MYNHSCHLKNKNVIFSHSYKEIFKLLLMKYFSFYLLITVLILSSCSPVRYGYISAETGLENELRAASENSPEYAELSKKIKFISETDKNYQKASENKTLLNIRLFSDYSFSSAEKNSRKITAVIKRDLHVPEADFRDTETDADAEDIKNRKYSTDLPENIVLPEKGLSFEGLYPDNSDYSLYRETIITADIPEKISEETEKILKNWFDKINISNTEDKNKDADNSSDENGSRKITWIGAVGDIMPARGVQDILIGKKDGKEIIFSDTLPLLQSFDFLIGNLEGPVTYHKTVIEKAYNFKFRSRVLGELKKAGFDYLSQVNNHCFDYEEKGFLDTLYYLDKYGIAASGSGKTLDEALKPARFTSNGSNFSITALADYPAEKEKFEGRKETEAGSDKPGILWPSDAVFNTIEEISSEDGISIVSVHGGYEWQNQPADKQKRLFRKLADLGADLVIGSHPHVLQPAEVYNGSFIIYSLGNFIFPGMDETEFGEESMILSLGFYMGRLLYINYIPVNIDGKFLSLDKSDKILKRFSELNEDFIE